MQPGLSQPCRLLREQHAVTRHREIAQRRLRGEQPDQARQIAAQQRLAARQPDLVDAESDEDVDEALDLLEVQDLVTREPDVLLLRHAVRAAKVAAVGHRDTQIAQHAAEAVAGDHAGCSSGASARSHSRISPDRFTPTSK